MLNRLHHHRQGDDEEFLGLLLQVSVLLIIDPTELAESRQSAGTPNRKDLRGTSTVVQVTAGQKINKTYVLEALPAP